MNFTREPIIETIITPKEGFKLILRNSHGTSQEELSVSSVEVVSFGNSLFFRSLEKPKPFLVPVTDYEVMEARETRSVLKKAQIDKSIKIGGGKSSSKSKAKAEPAKEEEAPEEDTKKRARKSSRRRRTSKKEEVKPVEEAPVSEASTDETEHTEPMRRTLLPPPTSLISEQISRYKDYLQAEGAMPAEEGQAQEVVESSLLTEEAPPMPEAETEDKVVDISEETPPTEESDDKS